MMEKIIVITLLMSAFYYQIKSIKEKMLKPKNQTLKQTKTFFSSKNPSDFTLTHHSLTLRNSLRDNSSLR